MPSYQYPTAKQRGKQNHLASGTSEAAEFAASHRGFSKSNYKKKRKIHGLVSVFCYGYKHLVNDTRCLQYIALVILTSYFLLFPVDMHECFSSHAVRLKFHAVFHGNSLKALPHSALE